MAILHDHGSEFRFKENLFLLKLLTDFWNLVYVFLSNFWTNFEKKSPNKPQKSVKFLPKDSQQSAKFLGNRNLASRVANALRIE